MNPISQMRKLRLMEVKKVPKVPQLRGQRGRMSLEHQMFSETEAGETRCRKFEQLNPNIACRVQRSSNSKGVEALKRMSPTLAGRHSGPLLTSEVFHQGSQKNLNL